MTPQTLCKELGLEPSPTHRFAAACGLNQLRGSLETTEDLHNVGAAGHCGPVVHVANKVSWRQELVGRGAFVELDYVVHAKVFKFSWREAVKSDAPLVRECTTPYFFPRLLAEHREMFRQWTIALLCLYMDPFDGKFKQLEWVKAHYSAHELLEHRQQYQDRLGHLVSTYPYL